MSEERLRVSEEALRASEMEHSSLHELQASSSSAVRVHLADQPAQEDVEVRLSAAEVECTRLQTQLTVATSPLPDLRLQLAQESKEVSASVQRMLIVGSKFGLGSI